ncbi:MAG: sodium-coupled transporter [Candidatus Thermoplasmatota archaeon]|nr:sodium-coupled transporter [Candidatus Thermoplasmatota archaeon]
MEQLLVFATLLIALILFMWGRVRHDIVALLCLIFLVIAGVVSAEDAFRGFAHPAVITVAAVLIVSSGLQSAGIMDVLGKWMMKLGDSLTVQVGVLSGLVCVFSAFMNNVGALAILMPVAIHIARKKGHSPSFILMPLAFASLLGGLTTLIGTPPNIIIATFRAEASGQAFGMFDFTPVGAGVAIAGVLFIALLGWRFLPHRDPERTAEDRFHIQDYITEVLITKKSTLKGSSLRQLNTMKGLDIRVLGLIRDNQRVYAPRWRELLQEHDILIIEADSGDLKEFLNQTKTELVGKEPLPMDEKNTATLSIVEAVVMPDSPIIGKTVSAMKMRSHYEVNLLAIARSDKRIIHRIDDLELNAGDVLLLQGAADKLDDAIGDMGCLPLADRGFSIGQPKKIALALGVFGFFLATIITGLLPVHIAFVLAAIVMVLTRVLSLRDVYTRIDWPVIILIGAMLPVGTALETTGGAQLIADQILLAGSILPLWTTLAVLLIATLLLSAVVNNAATVVLMAPVGIGIAHGLHASVDPFLIAIAIGASCAFLTPIGHQSNTLVLGPGGYTFKDYVKLGLPLSILIVVVAVPLIMYFWPM